MVQHYDALIVGGGPAGSTMARTLTQRGYRTLVVDKQSFPRDKTCAGWVTPAVLDVLDIDPADYARDNVMQPIHRFRIGMMGQEAVENDHGSEPVSYGIRRCEFDHYLLERSGSERAEGVKFKSLERTGDGEWCLNGEYQAPLVIGAGGHFCPVASFIGEGPGSHETAVTAKEVEFEMTPEQSEHCRVRGDTPELWFCRDLMGYAWIFRKGDYLNIGLGREDPDGLKDHLQDFVESMQSQGRIPEDLPSKFKGHAYLLYDHAERPLIDDGVLLIGDAAGLAYTQSGEGIRPAIESAIMAAEVIESTADYSAQALQPYADRLRERFGQKEVEKQGGLAIPEWAKMRVAPPLMKTHWFTKRVVTERWFLHEHVPTLETAS